ncbi:MAG TPA: peptidyl-prolyl cis-trans isomerase [Thermoanaerobaculia bacterium]|nr:peptidyl-prolyl cis-trans isomerase [Thermoanaerobaculia bacterium]
MRDSFHHLKWILIAVVVAFIFGFVFIDMGLGGGSLGGNAPDTRAFAARVNGETIAINDYYRALQNLSQMYEQMYGQQFTPEMAEQMGLPKQVLDSLVDQRLLTQEARRMNLNASPDEVRKKLMSMPTFVPDGKFVGMELYRNYVVGRLGYPNTAAFEEDLGREITLSKMESALASSLVISPKAAEAEYRRTNENAKIRFVLLPAAVQAANITIKPEDVTAYYKANLSKYAHSEQRQVRYLLADTAKIRSQLTPTEQELRSAYEANRTRYRVGPAAKVLHILVKVDPQAPPAVDAAARAKAQSLVAQLRGGADFAALAQANSDDPSSSGNGGDMGWVESGQTVQPFEQAIFSVPLNTISEPIRSTEFGYHIVKVTERRTESVRPFEQVKAELTSYVQGERAKQVGRSEAERLKGVIRNNKPATAQAFASLANDKVTSNDSGWFGRGQPLGGIGNNPVLSEWVFSAKTGDISDPIGTPRGIAIAYVEGVRGAGTTPLTEIRPQVEADLRQEKGREAARAALAQQMAGKKTLDEIAAAAGQPAREATIKRDGNNVTGIPGDSSALIEAAMNAQLGQLQGPVAIGTGAVAFQVVEQKKVTPQELAENRAASVDTLRGQQARNLRATLLQRLRKTAEIELNDDITRPTSAPAGV